MTKPTPPARHPLETFRVRKDLTYVELAAAILKTTGIRRSPMSWLRICGGKVKARNTAQDAIDRFLAAQPRQGVPR